MILKYDIERVNKLMYIVKVGQTILYVCESFREAQNFVFIEQSQELRDVI